MPSYQRDDDDISLWGEYQAYCRSHLGVPDEYDDWVADNHLEKRKKRRRKNVTYDETSEF